MRAPRLVASHSSCVFSSSVSPCGSFSLPSEADIRPSPTIFRRRSHRMGRGRGGCDGSFAVVPPFPPHRAVIIGTRAALPCAETARHGIGRRRVHMQRCLRRGHATRRRTATIPSGHRAIADSESADCTQPHGVAGDDRRHVAIPADRAPDQRQRDRIPRERRDAEARQTVHHYTH